MIKQENLHLGTAEIIAWWFSLQHPCFLKLHSLSSLLLFCFHQNLLTLSIARAFSLATSHTFSLSTSRAFSLSTSRAFSLSTSRTHTNTHPQTHTYIHIYPKKNYVFPQNTHTHTHIYIYIYIYNHHLVALLGWTSLSQTLSPSVPINLRFQPVIQTTFCVRT